MDVSPLPRQASLWAILLICERLFRIYCRYSGDEKSELRQLLDDLWTLDLTAEEYTEADVSGIQSFLGSLYPDSGGGDRYVASGFTVSLIDVYDFLVDDSDAYIESIKLQGVDSIRHHLEYMLFKDRDVPQAISEKDRYVIEGSVLIMREIAAQANANAELQRGRELDIIKQKFVYDPLL